MIRRLVPLLIVALFACGRNESNPKPKEQNSFNLDAIQPSSSLIFAGIDPRSFPWKSSLYSLDLKTLHIKKILSGESSDPILFQTKNFLYFFNRTLESKNFRTLSFKREEIKPGPQIQFEPEIKIQNGIFWGDVIEAVEFLKAHKNQDLVFLSTTPSRAYSAAMHLREKGYGKVYFQKQEIKISE